MMPQDLLLPDMAGGEDREFVEQICGQMATSNEIGRRLTHFVRALNDLTSGGSTEPLPGCAMVALASSFRLIALLPGDTNLRDIYTWGKTNPEQQRQADRHIEATRYGSYYCFDVSKSIGPFRFDLRNAAPDAFRQGGASPSLQRWAWPQPGFWLWINQILMAILKWNPEAVFIHCEHGKHRSVAMSCLLQRLIFPNARLRRFDGAS